MNNIYKVIWSKAKNCYVVASEIARSHTKSASGSEKIGGVTRRSLLASLMALSLLCGGLGVAEATVHVNEGTGVTHEVYTTVETYSREVADAKLDLKADKTDVATNTANIATNADKITKLENDKLDKTLASETYATKDTLNALKDTVNGKADKDAVTTALGDKADKADVYSKTGADDKFATKDALNNKADKNYVDNAVAGAITTAGTNVDAKLEDYAKTTYVDTEVGKKANKATTLAGYGITDAYTKSDVHKRLNEKANKTDLTQAQTEIDGLNAKTTNITHDANGTSVDGVTFNAGAVTGVTSINGTKIGMQESGKYISQDGSIWGNMKKVDTQVETNEKNIETNKTAITNLDAGLQKEVADREAAVDAEKTEREKADEALSTNIKKETSDREAADAEINKKIGSIDNNQTEYVKEEQTISQNLTKLDNKLKDTNDRTGGITRNDAESKTIIEKNETVDSKGNVTAEGKLKAGSVDAGDGAITTTGAVNAGSLNVTDASNLKGDVTMDKTLKVTGDTSLNNTDVGGALNVTGASDLKGNVILGTDTANTVTVNGKADFKAAVNMDKGLTVTNGDTKLKATTVEGKLTAGDADLKNTTVDGTLSVNKETTLGDKLTAKGEATFEKNVTAEKDLTVNGTLKTKDVAAETIHISKSEENAHYKSEGSIIGEGGNLSVSNKKFDKRNNITKESQLNVNEEGTVNWATSTDATGNKTEGRSEVTADNIKNSVKKAEGGKTFGYEENITADGKVGTVTDKEGNTSSTRQDSKGVYGYAKDKDGNKSYTKQEGNRIAESVIGQDGKETKSEMTSTDITNTAKDGTITNDAKDIVNKASGNISNSSATMDTTVTGKATESYGELETEVKGNEKHTVKGDQINEVDGKQINTIKNGQENIISGGQTNTITGGQVNNITGDQTTTITGNKKETVTENVTEDYKKNLTTTVGGNEIRDVKGTKTETVEGKVTENFKGGQETNVTGNQDIHVTGKQTNKIDGDQENTIGGNQTTTVTGDISNKAKNITNEASNSITDKVGDHTRVLDSDGITDTVGGSTFKQRIDKIMMESKNVSIKAEETLTNEAKVITNKASEVINNEAVNINNTATGIIKSKASEIQNQADKLISNKVGENTWENMENGKITTSIKDGAKQNLTQSDAAGTTQSTVDGGKSTVTIQNADGLADAVTDGTNTSVQNQTASAIAAAVKDGAGNENASVANATTSVNTIKSGSKANTVISTADGTSFINSEAAAPVGDGTEVKTTIKGNTITTGKVTMDYAEVMKDLGVRGNANITGKTTTGSLEVIGTSTLKGDVTMGSNATVKKDLTVEGNTNLKNTKVDGTLDVTQKATFGDSVSIAKDLSVDGNATITGDVTANSYKVGDKTYISADGINANNQKITNVADGSISEGSKDAVNGGQLYGVKRDLEHQVDKVGANAAAMANLRPMEFDPSSKWNIAAAIGNYGSETAAAIGAFYRPNDNVMVNLSTAFGTGENMVGGGVSVRLGKGGNKLSREETNALKAQVADLTARMDALLSVLNPNMSKDFPDVPENHWAYEAVSRLAGNDIVQGYPDGEFHGERTMTRYEMAEIIYNALSRGAEAEKELVEEFKPELQAMAASEKATAEKAEG